MQAGLTSLKGESQPNWSRTELSIGKIVISAMKSKWCGFHTLLCDPRRVASGGAQPNAEEGTCSASVDSPVPPTVLASGSGRPFFRRYSPTLPQRDDFEVPAQTVNVVAGAGENNQRD